MYVFANGISLGSGGNQSGQIIFPATQNASSNVNTLDDYEEGIWTPTDQSGAGLSLTSIDCRYVKIGQLVTCTVGYISYPVTASALQATIGGLPFAVGNVSGSWVSGANVGFHSNGIECSFMVNANGLLYGYKTNVAGLLFNSDNSNYILYGFCFSYRATT